MKSKIAKRSFFVFLIAVLVVATLSVTVLAASDDGTITIVGTTAGKVYDVYRIFDLEYHGTAPDTTYDYTMHSDFVAFFAAKSITTDAAAVKYVNDLNAAGLKAFAEEVKAFVLDPSSPITPTRSVTAAGKTTVIDALPYGYYLVYPQGGVTAACSLTTTDSNVTVTVKSEYPEIDKKIVEADGDKDTTTGKIGDTIQFKLTTQVPDIVGYSAYTFYVTDVMSKGLTFTEGSVEVFVDGRTVGYFAATPSVDPVTKETTLEIVFTDCLTNFADKAGQDIVITYNATLNSDAVIGGAGNPNKVQLTYSNDPGVTTSTETTPEEITTVFTLRLNLVKVDAADDTELLSGAVFSLWTTTVTPGVDTKTYDDGGTDVTLYAVNRTLTTVDGVFSQTIKAGKYYLFEETPPTDYNKLTGPIIFEVDAVYDASGNISGLSITPDNLFTVGSNPSGTGTTGDLGITVKNRKGIELPSTGGIGAVVFIGIGALLMVGAIVLLLRYRKKNDKQKGHF